MLTAGALGAGALEDASDQLNGVARLELATGEEFAGMEAAEGNTQEAAGEARPRKKGKEAVDGFFGTSSISYRSIPTVLSSSSMRQHFDEGDMRARTKEVFPICRN